ncbi:YhgE/Pip family protein [Paenibacillus sp. GCM10027626]|uniref:YhgE/Pip family protein n=1 Tax=Paenibacillus sp. GCM10027626 TaxID=3273411 RepID=UPI00362BB5FA
MKNGMNQFGGELSSIVRNRKVLIPVIAVLMVPVLYTAMFLGAFWDPYDRLESLPVAVVNADKGTEFNGKELHVGEDFVDKLKENPQFSWEFVAMDEAEAGMKDNKYYMTIEIPEDFSEKTTTLTSDHPTPAKFKFLPNESYNFLASQIGNTAVDKMLAALNKEITQVYAKTVFDQVEVLADGLGQASEGAGQLADGTVKAKDGVALIEKNLSKLVDGSVSLQDGAAKLADGGAKLDQGITKVSSAAGDLSSGLAQLYNAQQQLSGGVTELGSGAASLKSGAVKLSDGLDQLAAGGGSLAGGASDAANASKQLAAGLGKAETGAAKLEESGAKIAQALEAMAKQNEQLAADPGFQQLLAGSKQLAAGLSESAKAQKQLSQGAEQLEQGVGQLSAGAATLNAKLQEASTGGKQLAAGGQKLEEGANKLTAGMKQFGSKFAEAKAGSAQLASGAKQLSGGAAELHQGLNTLKTNVAPFVDGSKQLKDGAGQVSSGLNKLQDGSQELSSKLGEAAGKTSDLHVSDSMYDMFAGPVESDVNPVNEVPNYGTGFAPYFLSLGLYVGALVLTIVYAVREPAIKPTSGWNWFWSKALTMIIAGTIQALVADAALMYILDLQVKSVPLFLMFSIFTSITFMMLIQFLVTTLQNPGRFIAIVILIFQLTSSAGTFPLELIPEWLQKVTPWLPMTYSVSGFKDVISSGDYTAMWHNAGMLGIFTALCMIVTMIYFIMVHRKTSSASTQSAEAAIS